jgi:META domain
VERGHYLPDLSILILPNTNMPKQILSRTSGAMSRLAQTYIPMAMLIVMGCRSIKAVINPPDEPLATKLQGTWVLTYLSSPGASAGAGSSAGAGPGGTAGGGSAAGSGSGASSGISIDAMYPDKKPLISFDLVQNEVNGNTGCNPFSSKMSIDGSKLTIFKPYAMATTVCNGEGEKVFLDILKSVTSYSVSHNDVLTCTGDAVVMRFTRK